MAPRVDDDWSDSDEEDGADLETSVQLGVPDGGIESAADILDAAVSRIGGHPAFLLSPEPPFDSCLCKNCSNSMQLLVQVWCPFENSPHDRALYVWGCANGTCQRKEGSVRAWRGLRYNERYAAKLEKKLAREKEKRAAHEAMGKTITPKANPFSMGATNAPNPFGIGAQVFGNTGTEADHGDEAKEDDVDKVADESRPAADPECSSEDEDDGVLVTAMASATLDDSEWANAPAYTPLYLSTTAEYLPPPSKSKIDTDHVDDDPSDGKKGQNAWALESYENSLEIDHAFERFSRRVEYESEQCMRYEIGGTPLPFASDSIFQQLFPAPPTPLLPITRAEHMVVPVQKRTYNPSTLPSCPHCHGPRVFECQLMPNLINVLKSPGKTVPEPKLTDEERRKVVEDVLKGKGSGRMGMEWGTCMVFACEKDCVDEKRRGAWREELVLVQWDD